MAIFIEEKKLNKLLLEYIHREGWNPAKLTERHNSNMTYATALMAASYYYHLPPLCHTSCPNQYQSSKKYSFGTLQNLEIISLYAKNNEKIQDTLLLSDDIFILHAPRFNNTNTTSSSIVDDLLDISMAVDILGGVGILNHLRMSFEMDRPRLCQVCASYGNFAAPCNQRSFLRYHNQLLWSVLQVP
jgi:hypothetical protein